MGAAGPSRGARPLRTDGGREARAARAPGGGDRSDPLSILAAADEAGGAVALVADGRASTFAELAADVRARMRGVGAPAPGLPQPLVGACTRDALVALYALLEARAPALLVHPRLTPGERVALEGVVARSAPLPADAAAVVFTSGTTGDPRAAVLTRRALVASAAASAANLGWQADDRWLLAMPVAHVGGLSIVARCLAARRAVVAVPKFDAQAVPGWIDEHRVTLASMVPTMLARVLDAHPGWRPPPFLRAILVGGAGVPPALLARAAAQRVPVLPSYGLTESCAQIACVPYEARFDPAPWASGLPLPGVELRIADGRIHVRGPTRMAGYWNEAPLAPDAWFDTGDLGEIDAHGCLHVHARRTDLVVTGGENVYPAEVERVLEAMPGIAAAGVFGVPSDEWGQEVAAALVARGAPPADADLRAGIVERLAPHKRPRRVCWVDALPHTAGGKLDRGALAGLAPSLRPLGRSE